MTRLAARCAALADLGDVELATRLLRGTPTHEDRADEQLDRWARAALDFADRLPLDAASEDGLRVEEVSGLSRPEHVLLAEYHHRRHTVVLHTDGLARLADAVRLAGWPDDADPGRLRTAAIAHEVVHHRLHGATGRRLRDALDHTAVRVGPLRLRGHVVGASEVVAHRYAHRRSGLRRSPLLLSAALAAALTTPPPTRSGRVAAARRVNTWAS